jgi:hypothetical protein
MGLGRRRSPWQPGAEYVPKTPGSTAPPGYRPPVEYEQPRSSYSKREPCPLRAGGNLNPEPAVMWSLSPARTPAPLPKIGKDGGISETCLHRSLKLADVHSQAGVSLRYFRIGQSPARCRCEQPGTPGGRPGGVTAVRNVRHADEPPGSPVRLIG